MMKKCSVSEYMDHVGGKGWSRSVEFEGTDHIFLVYRDMTGDKQASMTVFKDDRPALYLVRDS